MTGERKPGTIGFAALRGGDVVGEHTVIFAGRRRAHRDRARATSRAEFRRGRAARRANSSRRRRAARRDRSLRHARRARAATDARTCTAWPLRIHSISPASSRSSPAAGRGSGLRSRAGSAQAGARVVINGRNRDKLERGRARRSRRRASRARVAPFDVTDAAAVDAGIARHRARRSAPIDILVNNAAMNQRKPLDGIHARRMARADGGQPRRAVPRHARGAARQCRRAAAARSSTSARSQPTSARPNIVPYADEQGRAQDADPRARGRARAVQRAGRTASRRDSSRPR